MCTLCARDREVHTCSKSFISMLFVVWYQSKELFCIGDSVCLLVVRLNCQWRPLATRPHSTNALSFIQSKLMFAYLSLRIYLFLNFGSNLVCFNHPVVARGKVRLLGSWHALVAASRLFTSSLTCYFLTLSHSQPGL